MPKKNSLKINIGKRLNKERSCFEGYEIMLRTRTEKTSSSMPYGEARRLRYFVLICQELLASRSVNIDFLIDRILLQAKKVNSKLEKYKRKTGIMRTKPVARNYVRFSRWLNFLQLDGRLVSPNSYTVFVGNMDSWDDFSLSKKEKIGFFLMIIKKREIIDFITSLKVKSRVKDYTVNLSEHFVESFLEWLVDLGILEPSSKSFGYFSLTSTGYKLKETLTKNRSIFEASRIFSSCILNSDVSIGLSISDSEFLRVFFASLKYLAEYTRSELDSSLYSALPILLHSQLNIIVEFNQLPSLHTLIEKLKDISKTRDLIFNWDHLTNRGYIKTKGEISWR